MKPEQLANLHALCFETPRPWNAEEFRSLLNDNTVYLFEKAHGFALGRVAAGEAELLTLAVDTGWQRQGIGSDLLRAFEQTAATKGATVSFLEVSALNRAALALYASAGYSESGRRPNYYRTSEGHRIDAVVMSKSLLTQ